MEKIVKRLYELKNSFDKSRKIPSGCAFLTDDVILSYPQYDGNARYPYTRDGLTLWAYTAGELTLNEGRFNVFSDTTLGGEPRIAFFTGERRDGAYRPISITGVALRGAENDVERFTIFTPQAAYYFAQTKTTLSVLRAFVCVDKSVYFSMYIENISETPQNVYSSAYFDPQLTHNPMEYSGDKMYRRGDVTDYGYLLSIEELVCGEHVRHYAAIVSDAYTSEKTVSRKDYLGSVNRQLSSSVSLENGRLAGNRRVVSFDETAIAGEITAFDLQPHSSRVIHYRLILSDDKEEVERKTANVSDVEEVFEEQASVTGYSKSNVFGFSRLKGKFAPYEKVFAPFINNVVRQTEFCTSSKNYVGDLVGMRDIFQQIEGAIPTMPRFCRAKIIEALGFIGDDGRPPRQYSYPVKSDIPPAMDLREYVDQGAWIISTVYTYLCYTDDFSLLNEQTGYYSFRGNEVFLSDRRDCVLDHLVAIADWLISQIDEETSCVRALYGDWNDALDCLGKTEESNARFGDGVSVMVTLQLYKNMKELCSILRLSGKYPHKQKQYTDVLARLKLGLEKYAVISCKEGGKKILHGWGDGRKFLVCSDSDCDGKSRDGLTSNAFWVLSGMCEDSRAVRKSDILSAYDRLDSKYGLKTFAPHFGSDCRAVGRICGLPEGTAENGATYVHATLFAIWSLFEMGETERAWEQLYKILPITHDFVSVSPFVMPNSYAFNAELGLDGQSISDWFTGSGCVLLKILYSEVFGIKPKLDGVEIRPNSNSPFGNGSCSVTVKGKSLTVNLFCGNSECAVTKFIRNGETIESASLFIPTNSLKDGDVIDVYLLSNGEVK